jgi:hypothetical protein
MIIAAGFGATACGFSYKDSTRMLAPILFRAQRARFRLADLRRFTPQRRWFMQVLRCDRFDQIAYIIDRRDKGRATGPLGLGGSKSEWRIRYESP